MRISEIITDKYKLRILPTVYYDLLADVQELEEEQEQTTKNDLGVDCISREQALVAVRNLYPSMPRVDFNGSLRKWVDKYKPYIECDDAIKLLPSVTPQPRKGHWIKHEHNGIAHIECSECSYWFLKPHLIRNSYCPNCGAKMTETEG